MSRAVYIFNLDVTEYFESSTNVLVVNGTNHTNENIDIWTIEECPALVYLCSILLVSVQ